MTKKKAVQQQPEMVKRKGKTPRGTKYSISVRVEGATINGTEIPTDLASNAVADFFEKAIQGNKATG